jgi:cyclophilin family peptidyl-prolyl cis-trans isomerase
MSMVYSRFVRLCLLCCVALVWIAGCSSSGETGGPVPAGAKSSGGMHAVIETDKGAIEIEFLPADAPKAVENFRLLAEKGYFDGLTFHRIVRGFMIQGGDPSGDGTGGESAWGGTFEDEIKQGSALYNGGYKRGHVAMANAGPNTNGSQFFLISGPSGAALPPQYSLFGKIVKGLDVLDAMQRVPTGRNDRPHDDVVINSVTISVAD